MFLVKTYNDSERFYQIPFKVVLSSVLRTLLISCSRSALLVHVWKFLIENGVLNLCIEFAKSCNVTGKAISLDSSLVLFRIYESINVLLKSKILTLKNS